MKKLLVFLLFSVAASTLASQTCPSDGCEDSCRKRCGDKPNKAYSCQCNSHCERYGDCCEDYSICTYVDPTLNEVTHEDEWDIDTNLNEASDQDEWDIEPKLKKDTQHEKSDIEPKLKKDTQHEKSDASCKGRCGEKFKKKNPCHCNKKCGKFNNCCSDHDKLCGGGASTTSGGSSGTSSTSRGHHTGADISNEEIKAMSEKLYQSDVNKALESDIILNKQQMAEKTRNRDDLCDEPLYQYVNEELFKRPTLAVFIKLLDNYDRKTGIDETYSPEEIKEQENFLQEIMKTKLMKELYKFFHQKGLYKTEKEFVHDLHKMWFGLYSRSSGEHDSSGFEHVFVGEVKKGQVSGFHSWIRFYLLEKTGMMNYYSHNFDGPWTDYPDVLGKQFHWDGFYKEVGTQFIGSSPEFDFGIYTLCFISRPGKKCQISLGGHKLGIQTYEWTKNTYDNGKKFIATAYPVNGGEMNVGIDFYGEKPGQCTWLSFRSG